MSAEELHKVVSISKNQWDKMERMNVPGGWLYIHTAWGGASNAIVTNMCFVPKKETKDAPA